MRTRLGDAFVARGESTSKPRVQLSLVAILAAAAAFRIVYFCVWALLIGDSRLMWAPDSPSYVELARTLLDEGRFGDAHVIRTPGYPLFLAVPLGLARFVGPLEWWVVLLQHALQFLTAYAVARLTLRIGGSTRQALLAAALYLFDPLSLLSASTILSETLFAFLLTAALALLMHRRTLTSTVVAIAMLFVRPIAYFCLPLFALPALLRRRWLLAAVQVFLMLLLVGAWQMRNKQVADYGKFSAIGAINVYFYRAAAVLAVEARVPYYSKMAELGYRDRSRFVRAHPGYRGRTEGDYFRYLETRGRSILVAHPIETVGIHFSGLLRVTLDSGAVQCLRFWNSYPRSGGGLLERIVSDGYAATITSLARDHPAVFWSHLSLSAWTVFLWTAAVRGAVIQLTDATLERRRWAAALLVVAAYLLVASSGPESTGRFRAPVVPVVCLFAALGVRRMRGPAAGGRTLHVPEHAGGTY